MLNVAVAPESQAGQFRDLGERPMNTRAHAMPIEGLLEDRFTPVALKLFLLDLSDGNPSQAAVVPASPD